MSDHAFMKTLDRIGSYSHRFHVVFEDFLVFAFCALSYNTREELYLDRVKRWEKRYMEMFTQAFIELVVEMQNSTPFKDILGPAYMLHSSQSRKQWGGEFYTPQPLARAMAKMALSMQDLPPGRFTLGEPACGSGTMILAAAHEIVFEAKRNIYDMRVTAWDISKTAAMMCFINTTLWGIPCHVVHGNTITMEVFEHMPNIHYHRSGESAYQRVEANSRLPDPKKLDPSGPPVQVDFDFDFTPDKGKTK
jgi:hypothetical protein